MLELWDEVYFGLQNRRITLVGGEIGKSGVTD